MLLFFCKYLISLCVISALCGSTVSGGSYSPQSRRGRGVYAELDIEHFFKREPEFTFFEFGFLAIA